MPIPIITKHCPICNNKTEHEFYGEYTVIYEETIKCTHCNYYYEFAYGSYKERIGNKEFIWDYKIYDNNNKLYKLNKKIKNAMFIARRNQKKYKKYLINRKGS